MTTRKIFFLALSLVFLPLVFAKADFSSGDWRFFKAINVPSQVSKEGLVELRLDSEVFAKSAPGLRDLRIINAGNQREVPYQLVVEHSERERTTLPVSIRDKSFVPGQYTSFIADLGKAGQLHSEIEIVTSSINFRRTVSVEGSNDAASWAVLTPSGQIYDFTVPARGFRAQDTRVRYPESTVRYLRVKIFDNGEPPLQVSGARVASVRESAAQEVRYPASIVQRSEDQANRRSVLTLDLGGSGLASNRLELAVSGTNFFREVALEGSNDRSEWNTIASDVIYSYDTSKFRGAKTEIQYPETTWRYVRTTIFNADNPPLDISGATAVGLLRKIIFAPDDPAVELRLYYGNPDARYPSYELSHYFSYLETENLPIVTLAPEQQNPSFVVKLPPLPPFTERYPWLLPGVVVTLTAGFGAFLVMLFRRVKSVLPPGK